MKTLNSSTVKQPAVLAGRLFKLERCGSYEQALAELDSIWPDFCEQPDIEDLSNEDAAEMLLRCGSLIGLHGHNVQLADAPMRSKDLLSEARERFIAIENDAKAAECENHLAFAYWRTGEFNEADVWIDEALARRLPLLSDARLYTHLIKSLIDLSCQRYEVNVATGQRLMPVFRQFGDAFLTGSFYTNIGLSLKNLGKIPEALSHLELAKYFHGRSRHKVYLGTVENNLAQLYREAGNFFKAHEAIDNATHLFRQVKDKTREGYSFDTKALIYLAESDHANALKTVGKGLAILEKADNSAYLAETLVTKAKILLVMDNFSDAVLCLSDAINIVRPQSGEQAARRLIADFESGMISNKPRAENVIGRGDMELILPESIGHYSEYRGIWIKNSRLYDVGLRPGVLAVFVREKVERGDLAAVSERETGEVHCGFYDADFGIVCLEGTAGEPQIFNETDVEVLGKIVGACVTDKRKDGKMLVEPLTL